MKEGKFKHVKQQELIALQKRIQTGREEQKKQRHQDLERYVCIRHCFPLSSHMCLLSLMTFQMMYFQVITTVSKRQG